MVLPSHIQVCLLIRGQVQGVGFRPFVFLLAERFNVTGSVGNTPEGVCIEAQGPEGQLKAFIKAIEAEKPPLAVIASMNQVWGACDKEQTAFHILPTERGSGHNLLISPDVAVCAACQSDMQSLGNRRYLYPFANCTNCGPRYSITHSMPYDRENTAMACFSMCEACREEYENPRDRRFHAQPNACPACGPAVWFVPMGEGAGEQTHVAEESRTDYKTGGYAKERKAVSLQGYAAVQHGASLVAQGKTLAMKGLGGFHLVCNALDSTAVGRLRKRKQRPDKPFAIMVPDVETAKILAAVGEKETLLLTGPAAPIVVCRLSEAGRAILADNVSPDTQDIGLMLPYTPLHVAFFAAYANFCPAGTLQALIMTSGNRSGEPLAIGNREALASLASFVDGFLLHDRDILIRVDDSVIRAADQDTKANFSKEAKPLFFRRARGYVPQPIHLPFLPEERCQLRDRTGPLCVLGTGAELKVTLCLTKGDLGFVSQNIGDMENMETGYFYQETLAHLISLLEVRPSIVVHDLHPQFMTTGMAKDMDIPAVSLQHHFAHGHAVLAENQFHGAALVLALDGTGLGEDGALWGGELLMINTVTLEHNRLAHLAPMPLPGGEAAIKEPWRIAYALLLQLGMIGTDPVQDRRLFPWLEKHTDTACVLPQMLRQRINCPVSTSAGRLFDAMSAALGLCDLVTYEGQAAIRLEQCMYTSDFLTGKRREKAIAEALARLGIASIEQLCPCVVSDQGEIPAMLGSHMLFASLVRLYAEGADRALLACLFHEGLATAFVEAAAHAAESLGIKHVGLSGGCLHNVTLASMLREKLAARRLIPLEHNALPPGDGCISFGQAAYGRLLLHSNIKEDA